MTNVHHTSRFSYSGTLKRTILSSLGGSARLAFAQRFNTFGIKNISSLTQNANTTSSETVTNQNGTNLPIIIQDSKKVSWDDSADIVVVGFGGAGAVAAIQGRETGANVIALDRFAGGGATAFSGGVVYAGGTRFQKQSGYEDTAQEMYNYLEAENSPVNPTTLRRFCEDSNRNLEWLNSLGVPFSGKVFEEKTTFPPDGYNIYYSGNEKMPFFSKKAKPAPRGHRTAVNGIGGHHYYKKLHEAALQRNVNLFTHTWVTRLVVNSQSHVVGVEVKSLPQSLWKKHQAQYKKVHPWLPFNFIRSQKAISIAEQLEKSVKATRLIQAKSGVILTTGGFNRNRGLVQQHLPILAKYYDRILPLGSIGDNGNGLTLGKSVGGYSHLMKNISVSRTLVPPNIYANGVLVNKDGKRFINEAAYTFYVGSEILNQPNGEAWLILPAKDFWYGVRKSFFPGGSFLLWGAPALMNIAFGGTRRGSTLRTLAKKIKVSPDGLAKTIKDYSRLAKHKKEDPMGKMSSLLQPMERGPYFALNMSLANRFNPAQSITMGGLMVNEDTGAVQRVDGTSVKGLYAAGRVAVGICSGGFVSGMALADTVFSGRRAVNAALKGKS